MKIKAAITGSPAKLVDLFRNRGSASTNTGNSTFGSGTFGSGTFGGSSPVIDVATAKKELQAQILDWRAAGWTWPKIQAKEGKHVWTAYVALGGK